MTALTAALPGNCALASAPVILAPVKRVRPDEDRPPEYRIAPLRAAMLILDKHQNAILLSVKDYVPRTPVRKVALSKRNMCPFGRNPKRLRFRAVLNNVSCCSINDFPIAFDGR